MTAPDRMTCAEALDLAKRWASKGFHAFPIAISWDDKKQATNKRPLTVNGFYDATTDPADLERLFNAKSPEARRGVGCRASGPGPSGYFVLDPDIKNGEHGDDELAALEAEHGRLDTARAVTASGGGHVYIKKPPGVHIGNADLARRCQRPGRRRLRGRHRHPHPVGILGPRRRHTPITPSTAPAGYSTGSPPPTAHSGGGKGRWAKLDRIQAPPRRPRLPSRRSRPSAVTTRTSAVAARCSSPGPARSLAARASIGYIGPGVVKVFTSNWPPLEQDAVYDADQLHAMSATADNGTDRPKWAALIVDGKTWLTSGPDHPDPLWGDGAVVLAAKGQPTTIAGPQGAGKSVFGQRLALGHIGITNHILDIPIAPGTRNVLYLASDRPEQARLSMRRMVPQPDDLDTLGDRMRVWKGPPPEDVAKQPLMLLQMAEAADADLIVIDSAKDVALKLSADEVGAAYNSALQHCVAHDIEVVALHHPRKLSGETPTTPYASSTTSTAPTGSPPATAPSSTSNPATSTPTPSPS